MCRDRLNYIKNIALRVIAEDEFKPEPDDVIIPSEEEVAEPETPKTPTYIGQRTHMEQLPSGERRRVYEGGGVQVKVCPVCGYSNPIVIPICNNCRAIYKELEKIIRQKSKDKSFNENNRLHRLALFGMLSHEQMGLPFRKANLKNKKVVLGAPNDIRSPNLEGLKNLNVGNKRSYGPETLDQIWQNKGITPLGPDTITEVVPNTSNQMERLMLEMNSMRDEHGDPIMEEGVPKLQEKSNWYPLNHILREVLSSPSAKKAGIPDAMLGMDEFYETIFDYNRNNPDKQILHRAVGSTYLNITRDQDEKGKITTKNIAPEFTGKNEVGSGGRAVMQESVPDSKSSGFNTIWPLNDYTTPNGKSRSGITTVFADRLEYVEVMKTVAEKVKLERQVEDYKQIADKANEKAKGIEDIIKERKNLSLLLELRDPNKSLNKPQKIIDRREKARKHLEKNYGEVLDKLLDEILKLKEEEAENREKHIKSLTKLDEFLSTAQPPPEE